MIDRTHLIEHVDYVFSPPPQIYAAAERAVAHILNGAPHEVVALGKEPLTAAEVVNRLQLAPIVELTMSSPPAEELPAWPGS